MVTIAVESWIEGQPPAVACIPGAFRLTDRAVGGVNCYFTGFTLVASKPVLKHDLFVSE